MELLRRSLLVGCLLPGLWLLRLATLEPVVTVAPASGAVASDVQRVSGAAWADVLRDAARLGGEEGLSRRDRVVTAAARADEPSARIFAPARVHELRWSRGPAGRSAYVEGGAGRVYRVDLHAFTSADFRPGPGFVGAPRPPSFMLYPFQVAGLALLCAGLALFAALPGLTRDERGVSLMDALLLGAMAFAFAAPLFAVGGSVQALTRAAWLTVPCWLAALAFMHLFAKPTRNARLSLAADAPAAGPTSLAAALRDPAFVRTGAALLGVAIGPAAFLVAVSAVLWPG